MFIIWWGVFWMVAFIIPWIIYRAMHPGFLDEWFDHIFPPMMLYVFLIIPVGFGILLGVSYGAERVLEGPTSTAQLEVLEDSSSVHGEFFLGTGVIMGTMAYSYYTKDADGNHELNVIDHWRAKVRYLSTGETPRVDYSHTVFKDKAKNYWFWESVSAGDPHATFYIPEGSIKENIQLDAK